MQILFKNASYHCYEDDNKIYIKERSVVLIGIALPILCFGVLAWYVSRLPLEKIMDIGTALGFEKFLKWSAYIIIPLSALLLLMVLYQLFKKPVVFDLLKKHVKGRGIDLSFSEIDQIGIYKSRFAESEYLNLEMKSRDKEIPILKMADPDAKDELEVLEKRLQNLVTRKDRMKDQVQRVIARKESNAGKYLLVIILISVGVIWSVVGYFAMPDVIWVISEKANQGVLVWPMGIWIAVLGILQLFHVPIIKWMIEPDKWTIVAGLVWIGSYFAICWVG